MNPNNSAKKFEAKYGLPEKVQFCKKCIISNQRPSSVVEFKNKSNHSKHVLNNYNIYI